MALDPVIEVGGARVFLGDCRDVLRQLPDNSVDAVVTDPPYELNFMSKKWDNTGVAYDVTVWQECLRVLKPGGHILAFGGSRTWHRLAVAIEDAGFELRDSIAWLYGSGFPKSLDVSKAIDKRAGETREREHHYPLQSRVNTYAKDKWTLENIGTRLVDDPITDDAKIWQGWGTALKPAFEPVVVGRKPLVGTVAENVLTWGVGGLNIDGSRIGATGGTKQAGLVREGKASDKYGVGMGGSAEIATLNAGRWPANVILDEVTAGLLDEQSGVSKSTPFVSDGIKRFSGSRSGGGMASGGSQHNDSGGASRFFYVAKASKRDRNEGLEELPDHEWRNDGAAIPQRAERPFLPSKNHHPTVKPTQLMRYLIKLVTPPGGTVLDPFTGSGSTGKAALLDGFGFVGVELTEEYLPIIDGRLRWASEQVENDDTLF